MGAGRDIGDVDCCFCVPIKYGVVLIGAATMAYSFICMICLFNGDVRYQSGGYEPYAARLQALIGSAGIAFGLLGIQGALDSNAPFLQYFSTYQALRAAVLALVFLCDMRLLMQCEGWEDEGNRQMINLVKGDLCATARASYTLGFLVDMSVNVYFYQVCKEYARRVAANPAYVISFGDNFRFNHSNLKFYDPSIGEPGQYISGQTA
eukprot:TRINITY_DN101062_c0_g1_i1.p1 TRINITY_DN101062_c0_g1~~TRINITY_DN101062_c0_g1_i1.p1  ORF type:complete len:207 (+),score=28.62 TRINITY_DN101062_c0_g1_i1:168-788(+)